MGAQYGDYTDRETGLVFCQSRYYDPSYGRWLTRDPIGTDGGENLYAYCHNDPMDLADPAGLADVTVYFKQLDPGVYHSFIIVSDNEGHNPYIIRFGAGTIPGLSGSASSSGGSLSQSSGSRPYLFGSSANTYSNSSNSSCPGSSRGGPNANNGPFGAIEPYFGPYTEKDKEGYPVPDYDSGYEDWPHMSIVSGDSHAPGYYESLFGKMATRIGASEVPYLPMTTNSNASTSTVLERSGVQRNSKNDKLPVWAPGWSTDLP
jgi:RHS repeat-associated protein